MISEKDIEDMGPPQIELEAVKENPDGSMVCFLNVNAAGASLLMELGFNSLLLKGMQQFKKVTDEG